MYHSAGYGVGNYLGEVIAVPVNSRYIDPVSSVMFDAQNELLWTGTEHGHICTLQVPSLEYYAHWPCHAAPVTELLQLPNSSGISSSCSADGPFVLSMSLERLAVSNAGGIAKLRLQDEEQNMSCVSLEPGHVPGQVLVGRTTGAVSTFSLATGKQLSTVEVQPGDAAVALRAPVGRGFVLLGSASGTISLLDPRRELQVEQTMAAHPGGLAAMDARDDLVACCGHGLRQGLIVTQPFVKVYDVRQTLRPLLTLTFTAGPSCLFFHPAFSATLLVASASGVFAISDVTTGTPFAQTHQVVGHEGDVLTCCAIAPSGEALAFGSSGGNVHLWAETAQPRVHMYPLPLEVPPLHSHPTIPLWEDEAFSLAPQYPCTSERPLSYYDPLAPMDIGLPPRIIDPVLLKDMRVVDFVGYIQNPKFNRAKPCGTATRAVAPLRNARLQLRDEKPDLAAARATKARLRAASGGPVLPGRYHAVEIKVQSGLRFEEFDFSYYNRSRFAGLENDLPNCYANALLQLLYFIPNFRAAVLRHVPEPDMEICLACELSFLFRMLIAAHGIPCQATNLLRGLRQLREAAALGLLDGVAGSAGPPGAGGLAAPSAGGQGDAGRAQDYALGRRVAALSRFMLDHLHKEGTTRVLPAPVATLGRPQVGPPPRTATPPPPGGSHSSSLQSGQRSGTPPPPPPPRMGSPATTGGSSSSGGGGGTVATPASSLAQEVDALFALSFLQRTKCLAGDGAERVRESHTFQVDLQYIDLPGKAVREAREARSLGLSKGTVDVAAQHAATAAAAAKAAAAITPASAAAPPSAGSAVTAAEEALAVAAKAAGAATSTATTAAAATVATAPSFAELLRQSLLAVQDTRAWFDDAHGYQLVRQTRMPLSLPQVLAINCAPQSAFQAAWWTHNADRPATAPPAGGATNLGSPPGHRPDAAAIDVLAAEPPARLPRSLLIKTLPESWDVAVTQSSSCSGMELFTRDAATDASYRHGGLRAAYELTGVVFQIRDLDEAEESGSHRLYGGHLVAMIKVPQQYWEETPVASPVKTPPLGAAAAAPRPPSFHELAAAAGGPGIGGSATISGGGGGANAGMFGTASSLGKGSSSAHHLLSSSSFNLPDDLDDVFASLGAFGPSSTPEASTIDHATGGDAGAGKDGPGDSAGPQDRQPKEAGVTALPTSVGGNAAIGSGSFTGQRVGSTLSVSGGGAPLPGEQWVLFNDFSISLCPASEVANTYGGQKVPCLLHYSRVALPPPPPSTTEPPAASPVAVPLAQGKAAMAVAAAATPAEVQQPCGAPAPPVPTPVLTALGFRALCCAPPLQGAHAKLPQPRFKPLDMNTEAPRPGMLMAIDAEFVALAPPEKTFEANVEIQTRPARLALARVSVLRGEGPAQGIPLIDDYVRCTEPVYDYLTRFSGVVPGDLDVSTSRHHLVTLKAACLKLRYLVDAGVVLVGHGLRQDFRMANMLVPPQQIVDTVELFYFKRHRKLSLRFLASYLLGINIQSATHDSVEDARTALRLYTVYKKLVADNKLTDKLSEMYRWGKMHGWEPVTLKNGEPQAPTTV